MGITSQERAKAEENVRASSSSSSTSSSPYFFFLLQDRQFTLRMIAPRQANFLETVSEPSYRAKGQSKGNTTESNRNPEWIIVECIKK